MDAASSPARASVQGSESASGSASGSASELASRPAAAGRWTTEHVLSMRRWTPTLISFRTTRPPGFRFTPGHYARLGLATGEGGIVWRPYSMACGEHADHLEFLLVLVPGGEFSTKMSALRPGDPVLVEKASFGFLTLEQLAPGRQLWLLASGTGIGPFVSILRGPAVWRTYEKVIVAHSVRSRAELAWRDEIEGAAREALAAGPNRELRYLPVVTREPGACDLDARIPTLLADGRLERSAAARLSVDDSRVMACGNPEMMRELRAKLSARGFRTSRRGMPGQMAFENYW